MMLDLVFNLATATPLIMATSLGGGAPSARTVAILPALRPTTFPSEMFTGVSGGGLTCWTTSTDFQLLLSRAWVACGKFTDPGALGALPARVKKLRLM